MRDLEIRGSGNLLGADQSGHIAAVGYDLYVQLVAEAVAEARGEARPTPPTVALDVPGDAHLPKDYVTAEDARLEAYRRLASVSSDRRRRGHRGRVGRPLRAPARPGPRTAGPGPAAGGGHGAGHPRGHHEQRASRRLETNRWPGCCPVHLAASAEVRLRRLVPGAVYREDLAQLLIPIRPGELPADVLRQLLEELIPPDDTGSPPDTL